VIKSRHSKINYAKDLIASKITRSKNIGLNSINALPLDKGESSVGGKQKQPQNDNYKLLLDNNYEKGIMDFHNNNPKASKKSFISSSDAASTLDYPTIIPPMSYWDSNEARIFFATRDGETALQSIDNQIEILKNILP